MPRIKICSPAFLGRFECHQSRAYLSTPHMSSLQQIAWHRAQYTHHAARVQHMLRAHSTSAQCMNFIQHRKALPYLLGVDRFLENACSTPVFLQVSYAGWHLNTKNPVRLAFTTKCLCNITEWLARVALILAANWQEFGCMCSDCFNDTTSDKHGEEVNGSILKISLPGNERDAASTAAPCTGGVGVEA